MDLTPEPRGGEGAAIQNCPSCAGTRRTASWLASPRKATGPWSRRSGGWPGPISLRVLSHPLHDPSWEIKTQMWPRVSAFGSSAEGGMLGYGEQALTVWALWDLRVCFLGAHVSEITQINAVISGCRGRAGGFTAAGPCTWGGGRRAVLSEDRRTRTHKTACRPVCGVGVEVWGWRCAPQPPPSHRHLESNLQRQVHINPTASVRNLGNF